MPACELCYSPRLEEEMVEREGHRFCCEAHAATYAELHPAPVAPKVDALAKARAAKAAKAASKKI